MFMLHISFTCWQQSFPFRINWVLNRHKYLGLTEIQHGKARPDDIICTPWCKNIWSLRGPCSCTWQEVQQKASQPPLKAQPHSPHLPGPLAGNSGWGLWTRFCCRSTKRLVSPSWAWNPAEQDWIWFPWLCLLAVLKIKSRVSRAEWAINVSELMSSLDKYSLSPASFRTWIPLKSRWKPNRISSFRGAHWAPI